MNKFIYIIYFLFFSITITGAQEKIDFSGKLVIIKGWAKNLAIAGHSEAYIKIEEAQTNEKKAYDYEITNSTITISLFPTCHTIGIVIPKKINLKIEMADVVWETNFDHESGKDWRALAITNIEGDVESRTDGYHVALDKVQGSISVVTYGNITALLNENMIGELISLDTYLGNVTLKVPESIEANLSMRAKKGEVEISPDFKITSSKTDTKKKFKGKVNEGGLEINLHSEGGKKVSFQST